MSGGYASRLSDYPDKGVCGLPETIESSRAIKVKVMKLVELMVNASQVVVITGAGISTDAGIPDFRGPRGIWTIEKQQKAQQKAQEQEQQEQQQQNENNGSSSSPQRRRKRQRLQQFEQPSHQRQMPKQLENFEEAQPTICHRALTKLAHMGKIKYIITQNVDGLHKRAGLKREQHSSVHGCVFTEKCTNEKCGAEFFRDFDVGGMSFQPTGRSCNLCKAPLADTLLDWEDPLPQQDLDRAYREVETKGTLVLCLGTSLRIQPIGDLPLKAANFVIVNLQKTPNDEHAALIIRGKADDVVCELMQQLDMPSWQDEDHSPIERVWKPQSTSTTTEAEAKQSS